MSRKAIVRVLADPVMVFPALPDRIDVYRDAAEVGHVMEQLVAHLSGDLMPLSDRQTPRHRDAPFGRGNRRINHTMDMAMPLRVPTGMVVNVVVTVISVVMRMPVVYRLPPPADCTAVRGSGRPRARIRIEESGP
jgi:hypothetical protein